MLINCSGKGKPIIPGGYISVYPFIQNDTYVKATSSIWTGADYPYFATNPIKPLIGDSTNNCWLSNSGVPGNQINQRFHIDLGSAKIVTRIYYENYHTFGLVPEAGVKTFTFSGSNTAGDFTDLVYTDNGTWVQLTTSQSTFDEHVALDQPNPKFIIVTNITAFQYYAFKFADGYGYPTAMGIRRIELQIAA